MGGRSPGLRGWLARRTSTQLAAAMGVLAALALSGSMATSRYPFRAPSRCMALSDAP